MKGIPNRQKPIVKAREDRRNSEREKQKLDRQLLKSRRVRKGK